MKGLKGRIALVTGATGLLGSAISKRLAQEGAVVAVASRSVSKAELWVEQARADGGKYFPVQLDLQDADSVRNCIDQIVNHAGVPTIVVLNASRREGLGMPFDKITHEGFAKLFEVDIAGHVLLLTHAVGG